MPLRLTREPGERIYVGEGKNLVIIEYSGNSRGQGILLISAPNGVKVDREEIRDRQAAQKQRADFEKRRAERDDNRGNR